MQNNLNIFSPGENEGENPLANAIKELTEGLIYISETDSPVELFAGANAAAVTPDELVKQVGGAESDVEQISADNFFSRLTTVQDGYTQQKKDIAARWAKLRDLMEAGLSDTKVFRIGKIRIDIYVVGLDTDGKLTGIKTKAVET